MKPTPTVSVCIANYNGMDVIDACIDSILAQDSKFPVEIIVHDDASTDGSAQHIREKHPGIKLLESVENVGFCVANNRMAAAATGQYLLLLNNDAELYLDALSTLCKAAQMSDQPAILSLPQYNFDTGELIDIGSLLDPFLNPIPNDDSRLNEVGFVIGACLWVPKTLWLELGGFPEWFGSIGEDLYLCCRARLTGYPVRAIGISGYRHRVGASFGGGKVQQGRLSTTARRRALSERNKTFVMLLTYPLPLLLILLPFHFATLFLEGALLAVVKRSWRLWQEIYAPLLPALWRERIKLMALRHEIQAQRTVNAGAFFAPFRWLPWKLKLLFRHGLPEVR
jgi:GT2 family glycosyltransferase